MDYKAFLKTEKTHECNEMKTSCWLTELLVSVPWLLTMLNVSHIIVTIEFKMKERNMFL